MAAAQTRRQAAGAPSDEAMARGKRGSKHKHQQSLLDPSAGASDPEAVNRERASIASAWPFPHARSTGGSGGAGNRAPPHYGAGLAGRGRRGRGTPASPGRREPAAGETEAAGTDAAAFPTLAGGKDARKVYIGYEYQTLDGRRFLATPQQLAAGSAALAVAASSAAAAAAAAPPGASGPASAPPTKPGRLPRNASYGAVDAAKASATAATAASAAAAATAAAAAARAGAVAASFLLQHDAPLFLQPPPGLQPDPAAPPAQDGAPAWDQTPRRPVGLAQLARIFVVTPASASGAPLLAVRPTVQFRLIQPPQLPADAAEVALRPQAGSASAYAVTGRSSGGGATGDAREGVHAEQTCFASDPAVVVSGQGPAAAGVQATLPKPVPLPSDSLVVVSLPLAYGLPAEWLGWGGGMATGFVGDGVSPGGNGGGVADCDAATAVEGAAVGAGGGAGAGLLPLPGAEGRGEGSPGGPRCLAQPTLVPLVQVDDRGPFDARLVAGSALFPIAGPQP
ncbi:hypothetical protein GPECTOR_6g596 [Gonium pectorale]|uniref:Nonsense-mediated mRNA decay factor SMG8 n=1 Tax=Gonium pectorale TaxID=33097 RepID=A0A150GV13_GONPE|nr:hypothetical protein GPECTOR_6g596 [Gonium pectorale]|eukprot:KXZ53679.1 hypothetical protein GPECTOR_6g596 [Gonium pectorale]